MRRPMLNNSEAGQNVYDPFLGSGTTLIAAQSCGRICFTVELDPRYVDVAVRRWQALTGETAVLLPGTRPFDEIATERLAGGEQANSTTSPPTSPEDGAQHD
jgi:DNA methylase